jgi:hypothetical protein
MPLAVVGASFEHAGIAIGIAVFLVIIVGLYRSARHAAATPPQR